MFMDIIESEAPSHLIDKVKIFTDVVKKMVNSMKTGENKSLTRYINSLTEEEKKELKLSDTDT